MIIKNDLKSEYCVIIVLIVLIDISYRYYIKVLESRLPDFKEY